LSDFLSPLSISQLFTRVFPLFVSSRLSHSFMYLFMTINLITTLRPSLLCAHPVIPTGLFPEYGPSIRVDMIRTFSNVYGHTQKSVICSSNIRRQTSACRLHDQMTRRNKKLLERLDNLDDFPVAIESGDGAEQTVRSHCRTNTTNFDITKGV
jgi:hypothetical protein